MQGLALSLANPSVRIINELSYTTLYSGGSEHFGAKLKGLPASHLAESFKDACLREPDEISAILVVHPRVGEILEVQAFRGITSNYEIYLVSADPNALLMADTFRDAVASIPAGLRSASEAGALDYLIFRTTPGYSSLVSGISRLGHGELLRWRPGTDYSTEIIQSLERTATIKDDPTEIVAMLDQELGEYLKPFEAPDSCVTLLSGGVDSTVLHSYRRAGSPSISWAMDTPEYDEIPYMERASLLLKSRHDIVHIPVDDYLRLLEETTDLKGLPVKSPQEPMLNPLFADERYQTYLVGLYADTLFGDKNAENIDLASSRWIPLFRAARSALKGSNDLLSNTKLPARSLRRILRRLDKHLVSLGTALPSPDLISHHVSSATELPVLAALVGDDRIQERFASRRDYVHARVRWTDLDQSRGMHKEQSYLVSFFTNEGDWRQLALGFGKNLVAPFAQRSIVSTSLRIPADMRYRFRDMTKPFLKEMLSGRVPAYPINTPKRGGSLPYHKWFRLGPLADAQETYGLSSLFSARDLKVVDDSHPRLKRNLLTYAIWEHRVLKNSAYSANPNSRRLHWNLPLR